MNPNISNNNCPTCPACSHPPHLGACSRRMGGTAYSCGCLRQTPTPPARDDDKCWKCGGGVERTNTTLPGCDNDIFHDGQPPALPTEGAHPNGPVEGCPCHLCRYAFGEDSPADDAGGAEAWAYAIVDRDGKYQGIVNRDRAFIASIVKADNADDLAGAPFRVVPLAPRERDPVREAAKEALVETAMAWIKEWDGADAMKSMRLARDLVAAAEKYAALRAKGGA